MTGFAVTITRDPKAPPALFASRMNGATTLDECKTRVISVLGQLRMDSDHIGQVCGMISSDGPQHIPRNLDTLRNYTELLRRASLFPVYCAADAFPIGFLNKLPKYPQSKWILFWREILASRLVTDILLIPRWNLSEGARDEHETAHRLGLTVHYVDFPGGYSGHSYNRILAGRT